MNFSQLDKKAQDFLNGLVANAKDKIKPIDKVIPIYWRDTEDNAVLVEDWTLPWACYKDFEKSGKDYNIYRGGAGVVVEGPDGTLTVTDERNKTLKLFPIGISTGIQEGDSLKITAMRELLEELFLFSLDHKTRYLPVDFEKHLFLESLATYSSALNIKFAAVSFVGKLQLMRCYFNEMNSAYEEIYYWDIRSLKEFSAVCEEDWFRGGNSAIPVLAKKGEVTTIYTGQQGAQNLDEYSLHPAMPTNAELENIR